MLRRARDYIEALSQGRDPISGGRVNADTFEDPRLKRCLRYVAEVLEREAGAAEQRARREALKRARENRTEPVIFTAEQLERFEFSAEPISVADITRRLNALIEDPAAEPLRRRDVTAFLTDAGALRAAPDAEGSERLLPTDFGRSLGVTWEQRSDRRGLPCDGVYCDVTAQRFILDNVNRFAANRR